MNGPGRQGNVDGAAHEPGAGPRGRWRSGETEGPSNCGTVTRAAFTLWHTKAHRQPHL